MEQAQEMAAEAVSSKKGKKETIKEFLSFVKSIIITIAITAFILIFVAQLAVVDGGSMEGTLHNGDLLLLEKITQRFGELDRFDVIVFKTGNPEKPTYIKRIIGLPGETVYISPEGKILINGEVIEENYGKEAIVDAGVAAQEIVVPEGCFFVMGDNRNNSLDSRRESVGFISEEKVVGRVLFGIMPFNTNIY